MNEESSFHTAVALTHLVFAQKKIVVDINGGGDFKTIQEAINSLAG